MDECHTFGKCVFDLKINLGHSTYISRSTDFSSFIFCSENILVLLGKLNSGELRCPATALISLCFASQS